MAEPDVRSVAGRGCRGALRPPGCRRSRRRAPRSAMRSTRTGTTESTRTHGGVLRATARRGEPTTASLTVAGSLPAGAAMSSVTNSGLPPVAPNTSSASFPDPAANRGDGLRTERGEVEVGHVGSTRRTDQPAERVGQPDVLVSVGEHQHDGQLADTRGDLADDVEGGVVGPVQIFETTTQPLPAPRAASTRRHAGRREVVGEVLPALCGKLLDEIPNRAEGPRCDQVVAPGLEHWRTGGGHGGEAASERRLADACLTGDPHDAPRAGPCRVEGPLELGERLVTLEERGLGGRWRGHGRWARRPAAHLHRHDHAVAPPVRGGDDRLARPVVADRPAGGLDPARKRRLAHEPIPPDGVEQLLLRHDAIGVGGEVDEHVEDLWLDRECAGWRGAARSGRGRARHRRRRGSTRSRRGLRTSDSLPWNASPRRSDVRPAVSSARSERSPWSR